MNAAACIALGAVLAFVLPAQNVVDRATHTSGFVRRDGVRLHYVEWPNAGTAVVLMPGYSLTAHAFDDIAPALATNHRVVALTPRGFGESDAPEAGAYTIATLVGDLRTVLDSLHIARATLVGHSISGTVATQFALQYPERVVQLILLDSYPYFNQEGADSIDALNPVATPEFSGDTTYEAVARYLARYRFVPWQPALLADLHAKPMEPEASRRRELTAAYIADQWKSPPQLQGLTVPAVEFCAIPTTESEYPWLRRGSRDYTRANRYVRQHLVPLAHRLCARFARTAPRGDTIVVAGSHYVFFTKPARTAAQLARIIR
ncbi:MAG: alpha/beta hydrolase [Gemmatimonadota bacterium]